jgi:hypothetical protein
VGIIASFVRPSNHGTRWFIAGLFVFSVAAVGIGLGGYQHYYVLLLPALALGIGYAAHLLLRALPNQTMLGLALVFALALHPIALQSRYFFAPDHTAIHRKSYGVNPFPEMIQIAEHLKTQLPAGATVGILGSEPELPFYLNAPPATRHQFVFPMLYDTDWSKKLQVEYLSDLEKSKPAFLLWVTMTGSWAPEYYKTPFFRSTRPLVEQAYGVYGLCEVFENGKPSVFKWGADAAQYKFEGTYQIYIYKRKSSQ